MSELREIQGVESVAVHHHDWYFDCLSIVSLNIRSFRELAPKFHVFARPVSNAEHPQAELIRNWFRTLEIPYSLFPYEACTAVWMLFRETSWQSRIISFIKQFDVPSSGFGCPLFNLLPPLDVHWKPVHLRNLGKTTDHSTGKTLLVYKSVGIVDGLQGRELIKYDLWVLRCRGLNRDIPVRFISQVRMLLADVFLWQVWAAIRSDELWKSLTFSLSSL